MQQVLMTGACQPPITQALEHYLVTNTNSDDRRGDLPRHIADLAPCATDLHLVCRWTWHSSWKIDLDFCSIIHPYGAQLIWNSSILCFGPGYFKAVSPGMEK